MRSNIIGRIGLLLIAIALIFYLRDIFNAPPVFLGDTSTISAYVINNSVVPYGKGATHRIDYQYTFKNKTYSDHYFSNKSISKVEIGDSLKVEVSVLQPDKNKIISFYRTK